MCIVARAMGIHNTVQMNGRAATIHRRGWADSSNTPRRSKVGQSLPESELIRRFGELRPCWVISSDGWTAAEHYQRPSVVIHVVEQDREAGRDAGSKAAPLSRRSRQRQPHPSVRLRTPDRQA
jgi:hypothetical protein